MCFDQRESPEGTAPCGKFAPLDKQSERRTNHFGSKWLRQHSWLRILLKICHRHIFSKILQKLEIRQDYPQGVCP
ncbi:MAG: hypothetical protein LUF28_10055, partial [Clostridiales bacterium]|nr:hypothetical protein [Clostridiales bacterium]